MAEEDKRFAIKKPCESCPFSKKTPPGPLGNPDPGVYVGQAYGPFMLTCHNAPGYWEWKEKADNAKTQEEANAAYSHMLECQQQCAGAAIFRSNVGVAGRMPEVIHKLPADGGETAFKDAAELVAHRLPCSIEEARELLEETPPEVLLQIEFSKLQPKNLHLGKKK